MKKIVIALLLIVAMVATLASCGKKFTCDGCDEEKTGKAHEYEFFGEEMVLCDDCYEEMEEGLEELEDELGDLGDDLEDLFG